MVQAANTESRQRDRALDSSAAMGSAGRAFGAAVMVVVVHELSQHPSEMALVEQDDVIETLGALQDRLRKPVLYPSS